MARPPAPARALIWVILLLAGFAVGFLAVKLWQVQESNSVRQLPAPALPVSE
jgi:hypothetical protein